MTQELKSLHIKALRKLSSECHYDETGFITLAKLVPGIGEKTMHDLVEWGLATAGTCQWTGNQGYRITDTGEAAKHQRPVSTRAPRDLRLREMPKRTGQPKSRFEK